MDTKKAYVGNICMGNVLNLLRGTVLMIMPAGFVKQVSLVKTGSLDALHCKEREDSFKNYISIFEVICF